MNDTPNRDPEVVGTIQLDRKTQLFYKGAYCAQDVDASLAGHDFPNHEAHLAYFWYTVGANAAVEHGCETSEDFTDFMLGATTNAPRPPDADLPEFEYVVEYDDQPIGLYYERAEQELTNPRHRDEDLVVNLGVPPTVTDVKRLATQLRDKDAKVIGVHLLCPQCLSVGEIVLVDISQRWNRLSVEEADDMLGIEVAAAVHEGNGDYQDDHYLCTARVKGKGYCHTKLEAPEGFDVSWG